MARDFNRGVAPVANESGLYGVIGKNGNVVVDFNYFFIDDYDDNGYTFIYEDEITCGVIDTKGNIIVPCEYYYISSYAAAYPTLVKNVEDRLISAHSTDKNYNKLINFDYDIMLYIGNGMVFCKNIGDETSALYRTSLQDFVAGDINGDGKVTVADIITLREIILGRLSPTPVQQQAADINKDGSISVVDVVALRKIIMESE